MNITYVGLSIIIGIINLISFFIKFCSQISTEGLVYCNLENHLILLLLGVNNMDDGDISNINTDITFDGSFDADIISFIGNFELYLASRRIDIKKMWSELTVSWPYV